MTIYFDDLTAAVDELAPPDCPLMVHVRLSSFGGRIEGGPGTLLDALLTRGRTVLVPSFTEPQFRRNASDAPAALRAARNGIDYSELPEEEPLREDTAYTRDCGLINAHLGAFPATLIRRAGAVRGDHPLNSFAALGPRAGELIAGQTGTDVYGPIRALAKSGGRILLIGVGLNRMTAIHLAEQQSGRRLFIRWAKTPAGQVSMFRVGSCSEGFPHLDPALREHEQSATVGGSQWRAFPASQVLEAATAAIRDNPGITHCGSRDCLLCRDSTAGGPELLTAANRAAITDLINLHGHLTDEGDFDGMSALFTEDVTYDVTSLGGGVLSGLTALREAALALGEANPVAHHVTNIVLEEEPDGTVRARSKGLGVMADGSCGSVTYDDTIQWRADGWRITHRVVRARSTPLRP